MKAASQVSSWPRTHGGPAPGEGEGEGEGTLGFTSSAAPSGHLWEAGQGQDSG